MSKTLTQTVEQLAPDQLAPNPWNRKHFNAESLEELADSIRSVGIIEPIIVRPMSGVEGQPPFDAPFQIIAGERRWRAAQLAGLPWVPCILREVDDRGAREAHAIENLQREDLNAIEEGENYRQLLNELGCKVEDLQARLGKKRSHIYARLKLVDLPEPIRDAIIQGQIDATVGTLLASIPVKARQLKALGEVMNGGSEWDDDADNLVRVPMSFRKARKHIEANYRKPLVGAWFDPDAEGLAGAHACTKCPLRTGNIPGLPSGSNPMVCTEPKCFEDKTAAHCAKLLDVHRQRGEEVLEGKAAAKLWQYGGLAYNSGFVDGAANIPLPKGKFATIEKALGKRLPAPFYAVNPQGKVCTLYRKTAVDEALVAAGLRQPPETAAPAKPQSAEDAVRADIERKVAVLSRDVLATELVNRFDDATKAEFNDLLLFIIEAMDNSDGFNHDVILRRRGWTGGHLVQHAKALGWPGKLGLLLEAFLCDPYGDSYEEDQLTKLADTIGHKLNIKAAEKQVREQLEIEAGLTKPKASVEQKAAKETKADKPTKPAPAKKAAKGKARK